MWRGTRTYRSFWLSTVFLVLSSSSSLFAQDGFWDYIHELSGPKVNLFALEVPVFPHVSFFGFENHAFRTGDDYEAYITFAFGTSFGDQDADDTIRFRPYLFEPAVQFERFSDRDSSLERFKPEIYRVGYAIYHFDATDDAFENFSNDAITFTLLWNVFPNIGESGFDFLAGARVRRFARAFTPEDFGGTVVTKPTGETVPSVIIQVRWRPRR